MCDRDLRMSWLEYYQSVKRGDVETVRNASDMDFRVTLTMDKCALQLAALYGYGEMVDYFLTLCHAVKDFRLVSETLEDALCGGHLEVSKNIYDFLRRSKPKEPYFIAAAAVGAAIGGKNLQCLEFAWGIAAEKSLKEYGRRAFSTGSFEVMKFLYDNAVRSAPENGIDEMLTLAKDFVGSKMPPSFAFWALNDPERALQYKDDIPGNGIDEEIEFTFGETGEKADKGRQYAIVTDIDGGSSETFSEIDVLGYFGHLDVLKTKLKEMNCQHSGHSSQVGPKYDENELKKRLESVFKYALRNNHINILEFMIENDYVTPKAPYHYGGFLINDAFYYLKKKTENNDKRSVSRDMYFENLLLSLQVLPSFSVFEDPYNRIRDGYYLWMTRLHDNRSADRLARITDYYHYMLEGKDGGFGLLFFMTALSHQNVDAALCVLERLPSEKLTCKAGNKEFHRLMFTAMSGLLTEFEIMPSSVTVELLLKVLKPGTCICNCELKWNFLKVFLRTKREWCDFDDWDTVRFSREHRLQICRADVILEILFRNGARRPTSKVIIKLIKDFFNSRDRLSLTAGKISSILNCCRVKFGDVNLDDCVDWFLPDWMDRDEILTDLLIAIWRNGWGQRLKIKGMLIYSMQPAKRKEHFLNVLEKTGIRIVDSWLFSRPALRKIPKDEHSEFSSKLTGLTERVPSLQEWSRYSIHHYFLQVAHKSKTFLSVNTLINGVLPELPLVLRDYLQMRDLRDTIPAYESRRRNTYLDKVKRVHDGEMSDSDDD